MERTTTITAKGHSHRIRKLLGLEPHDEDHQVRLAPALKSVVARTAGLLRSNIPAATPQAEKRSAEEAMAGQAEPTLHT